MRRAQTEPLAALVAVTAVAAGLGLYANALAGADAGGSPERAVVEPTLERVHNAASVRGAVRPSRVGAAPEAGPAGYALNVTVSLRGGERRWSAGPAPPADVAVERTARPTGVRIGPGRTRAGTIRVVIWT